MEDLAARAYGLDMTGNLRPTLKDARLVGMCASTQTPSRPGSHHEDEAPASDRINRL